MIVATIAILCIAFVREIMRAARPVVRMPVFPTGNRSSILRQPIGAMAGDGKRTGNAATGDTEGPSGEGKGTISEAGNTGCSRAAKALGLGPRDRRFESFRPDCCRE
jgi:hypothetical protein